MILGRTAKGDLVLPSDVVTQPIGVLGRRGSGKSYTAGVIAEGLLAARQQVIVLDPVGTWWGLRLAADGKGPGCAIPVFGGAHGDVPIEPGAGALLADLIVDKALSAVLDVSELRKGPRKEFVTAFAEQLFHRKKKDRSPAHLMLEEAQVFAPQQCGPDEKRMLGAIEDLVRLGRNYGIGVSMLSQRPQSVNKEVLSQVECLIVLQTSGAHERKAIEAWVVEHGIDVAAMVRELPALAQGEAFVWSPQWLRRLDRVRIAKKRTFDASATPTRREREVEPRQLEAGELEQLRGAMADVVKRAEENDPTKLRRRIEQLKRDLSVAGKATPATNGEALARAHEAGRVEIKAQVERILGRTRDQFNEGMSHVAGLAERMLKDIAKIKGEVIGPLSRDIVETARVENRRNPQVERHAAAVARVPYADNNSAPGNSTREATASAASSRDPRARILRSLAWWAALGVEQPTRTQVAFVARYTVNGHFNNTVCGLKVDGLIEYPNGCLALTMEGFAAAPSLDVAPSRDGLIEAARAVLRVEPLRRVFDVLVEHGEPLSREKLATDAGYTVNGHFNNVVGRLRTLGLADYPSTGSVGLSAVFDVHP